MKPFLAIVWDTWRQSKQQIVFFVLLGLMVLLAAAFIGLPKVYTTKDGEEILSLQWQDSPQSGFERNWDAAYRQAVLRDLDFEEQLKKPQKELTDSQRKLNEQAKRIQELHDRRASGAEMADALEDAQKAQDEAERRTRAVESELKDIQEKAQQLVDARSGGVTKLEKGVEVWMSTASGWLFVLSMWGFVAACAGYFPGMLAAGAVDVLVSKPIGRHQLFIGKYAGGLVLYTAALIVIYLAVFLGMGLRTGVWHLQFFSGMPLTIFSVALLYAIVALIGVLTRSTALAMIIGYIFYFVIDSIVSVLQRLGDTPLADNIQWLGEISTWSKRLFPGFGRLEAAVEAAVVNVPIFEGQAILVGFVWLVVCLGLAFERFRRIDF